MKKQYSFDAVIHEDPENGGAYVIFPWDIRQEFGKGRVKVHAEFDGVPYDGSILCMLRSVNGRMAGNETDDFMLCGTGRMLADAAPGEERRG